MKLYKLTDSIGIGDAGNFCLVRGQRWDEFVNDDLLYAKMNRILTSGEHATRVNQIPVDNILAPIESQELWASGVTYNRSKIGRQEESKKTGGGDFYGRVYEAERPELFFKANAHRIVGSGRPVRIRKDSAWNVPEPELTLVVTSNGTIVGYTIGNDMSSRSIEGENPLYLPQAKTYDGCASLGPCIYVSERPLPNDTSIVMEIWRGKAKVFEGSVGLSQMKRSTTELVSFLYRECSFPYGSLLMTGTGIVPSSDFTLQSGDRVCITIEPIGTLENPVA
jgi:2-dehydro-3-deoxy-D-arabinonate dehydratase